MSNCDLFKFQRTFEDARRKGPFDSSICPPLDQALDEAKGENLTATFVQNLLLWLPGKWSMWSGNMSYSTSISTILIHYWRNFTAVLEKYTDALFTTTLVLF
ncbi:hypothetical protein Dsin_004834 [Dipteronia sinensis]|uniref:Uncharacterized protein n=1 Tax=Dipteronia sinensis TaxID=43782 RepID=A0AAE0AVR6_9ROSI|nr:hypothetical protein Dsin_004834 [Dipteronia sinensis]